MANAGMKPVAGLLLVLNFCMYVIVAAVGGWAINHAINYGFFIGNDAVFLLFMSVACVGLELPAHFSPIYFPIGNAATGFFVIFAVIAGVVGAASALAGFNHVRAWSAESLPAAASAGFIAWTLTLLAMGLAVKEIELHGRNARLICMESFTIILSVTQLFYLLAIHGGLR